MNKQSLLSGSNSHLDALTFFSGAYLVWVKTDQLLSIHGPHSGNAPLEEQRRWAAPELFAALSQREHSDQRRLYLRSQVYSSGFQEEVRHRVSKM